jgi:hypothetical protein
MSEINGPSELKLSFDELSIVKEIIVSSFNKEFFRPGREEESLNVIKTYFLSWGMEKRLYSMFVSISLLEITEEIYTNTVLRDFVLNFSTSVMILLSVEDFDIEKAINTIASGISANTNVEKPYGLINEKIRMVIQVEKSTILSVLKNNPWLLCLVFLYLFIDQTELLKATEVK